MIAGLWDSHCHLQDPRCAGRVPELLGRARVAGVDGAVCCATGEADWEPVLALARAHPGVVPMLGLHPWFVAGAAPGWADRLRERLAATGAGVGECGLDFAPDRPARALQEAAFERQLALAADLDRPVAIHCVRAWGALLERLRATGQPPAGALVHAFSGSPETAAELQALGAHLSFGPAATRDRAGRAARGRAGADPGRVLVETDAPFGAPEPAQAAAVAVAAARLRGEDPDALAVRLAGNAQRFFGRLTA
jgi:TatD DNase family protein